MLYLLSFVTSIYTFFNKKIFLIWVGLPGENGLVMPLAYTSTYLVQVIRVNFPLHPFFPPQLPHCLHALPLVLLSRWQQQAGDGVVELWHLDGVPGAHKHYVCNNRGRQVFAEFTVFSLQNQCRLM